MQIWSPRAYANIDFGTRTTAVVRPSEALLRGEFHAHRLDPDQVEHYKTHLAEEHLPRQQQTFAAVDALALELQDFVDSILSARQPRVNGEAGRNALAVAEQILGSIDRHARTGFSRPAEEPAAVPYPLVVPKPHFNLAAIKRSESERKAG